MAWNGSGAAEVPRSGANDSARGRGIVRGIVAGLVVVLGVAAVWFLRQPSAAKPPQAERANRSSRIAESAPEVPTAEAAEVAQPVRVDPDARPTKVGEVVNGYVMLPSGRIHRRRGVITNSVTARVTSKYSIFDHHCENLIANLLMAKPGTQMLGTQNYKGKFKDEFLKSLERPIIIHSDDSAETAQLKRMVIDTKADLKAAHDRGEDIEQIITDTCRELQDLGVYKLNLRMLYNDESRRCETEADLDALRDSCNKMLEKKGCEPLKFTPLTRRNLMNNQEE